MECEISKIAYIPKYTVSPVIARIFGITPTTPSLSVGRKPQIITSIQVKNSPQVSPYFDFALRGVYGGGREFFSKNGEGVAQSVTLVETMDYFPYGNQRISTNPGQRQYVGEIYDTDPGLNYLNARYYEGSRGQFLSEDPVFLGDPKQQDLTNPQSLNSYSYGGDNPITNKDPSGRAFGVDDLAGFGIGGTVGVVSQLATSYLSGQRPTGGELAGAFVTGGIIGWGAVNTPETLGASNAVSAAAVAGLTGGFYGNLTKQGIDMVSGNQKGIDPMELSVTSGVVGVTGFLTQGLVPDAGIQGLSAGRGNMNAIAASLRTKAANGTVSSISVGTGIKSAIGSQASDAYRTVVSGLVDLVKSLSSYNNSQQKNGNKK